MSLRTRTAGERIGERFARSTRAVSPISRARLKASEAYRFGYF